MLRRELALLIPARIKVTYLIPMKQNDMDIGKYKKSNCNAPAPFFSRGRMPLPRFWVWDPALKEDDNCVQALTLCYEELNYDYNGFCM